MLIEYIRGGTLGQNWVDVGVLNPTRAVFYARYIDWTITTPLLLLELLLTTGLPLTEIFSTIFMDELMIITGLIGALVASEYKWVSSNSFRDDSSQILASSFSLFVC